MTILEVTTLFLAWVLGVICGVIFSKWAAKPLTEAELRMAQHELDDFDTWPQLYSKPTKVTKANTEQHLLDEFEEKL